MGVLQMSEVPVQVAVFRERAVREAMDFLERDAVLRQRAKHNAAAFGSEVDGQVGVHGRRGMVGKSSCDYMIEVNHKRRDVTLAS